MQKNVAVALGGVALLGAGALGAAILRAEPRAPTIPPGEGDTSASAQVAPAPPGAPQKVEASRDAQVDLVDPPDTTASAANEESPVDASASPDTALNLTIRRSLKDPAAVLKLVAEAEAKYPESPHAAEWSKRKIDALVATDDYRSARREAESMVNVYRGSTWAREVERDMGAHPRPGTGAAPR